MSSGLSHANAMCPDGPECMNSPCCAETIVMLRAQLRESLELRDRLRAVAAAARRQRRAVELLTDAVNLSHDPDALCADVQAADAAMGAALDALGDAETRQLGARETETDTF